MHEDLDRFPGGGASRAGWRASAYGAARELPAQAEDVDEDGSGANARELLRRLIGRGAMPASGVFGDARRMAAASVRCSALTTPSASGATPRHGLRWLVDRREAGTWSPVQDKMPWLARQHEAIGRSDDPRCPRVRCLHDLAHFDADLPIAACRAMPVQTLDRGLLQRHAAAARNGIIGLTIRQRGLADRDASFADMDCGARWATRTDIQRITGPGNGAGCAVRTVARRRAGAGKERARRATGPSEWVAGEGFEPSTFGL